ncbi:hypothetical protein CALCODRAFT_484841 [Calocera cornea HHB12733]|uniref:Uncharacterized protein n=1 Tax=Calocera cornea HHB12733 TaxID=1353952 RepID=A0A165ERH7_9BASI|nr:hypothetical protein CALCODRAFT_484841 [Calocera cornea HHB12733]
MEQPVAAKTVLRINPFVMVTCLALSSAIIALMDWCPVWTRLMPLPALAICAVPLPFAIHLCLPPSLAGGGGAAPSPAHLLTVGGLYPTYLEHFPRRILAQEDTVDISTYYSPAPGSIYTLAHMSVTWLGLSRTMITIMNWWSVLGGCVGRASPICRARQLCSAVLIRAAALRFWQVLIRLRGLGIFKELLEEREVEDLEDIAEKDGSGGKDAVDDRLGRRAFSGTGNGSPDQLGRKVCEEMSEELSEMHGIYPWGGSG